MGHYSIALPNPAAPPNPSGWLSGQRFVEGFLARLVEAGWRSISPKDPETRRGLTAVVAKFDDWIASFEDKDVDWDDVAPWVQTANSLRPSSLGGLENWERQLRLAQGYLVRVPNPDYQLVDLPVTPKVAHYELSQFSEEQRRVIELAYQTFVEKHHQPT